MFEDEYEGSGKGVDFDDLMHWVETARPTDITGLGAGDAPRQLFSARTNPAWTAWENPVQREKTLRFAETMKRFKQGRINPVFFTETISTSDFGQLTTNLLSWRLLALYTQAENVWETIVDVNDTIPDFRNIQVTRMQGLDSPMPKVAELADYQMDAPTALDRTYKLAKYGRKFAMSWEAKLNDWLRMFDKVPQALANGARNTENLFVTGLLAAAAGPNPLLFSTDGSTNGVGSVAGPINEITGAAGALSIANLKAGYTAMATQQMANGNPLNVRPKYLVVPAALKMTAEEILNAQMLVATNVTTSGSTPAFASPWNVMSQRSLTVIENRWLNAVDKSGNVNKTWYLVADPAAGGAPIEVGFLMGHRTPEIFRRAPGQESLAGGVSNPDDGDFENDSMGWKARHVMGGLQIEPLYAFAFVGP